MGVELVLSSSTTAGENVSSTDMTIQESLLHSLKSRRLDLITPGVAPTVASGGGENYWRVLNRTRTKIFCKHSRDGPSDSDFLETQNCACLLVCIFGFKFI